MNFLEEIINYLIIKYEAKAILLSGSRVGNYYSQNSDWDLIVFTNKKNNLKRDLEIFKGEVLDIEFKGLPVTDDLLLSSSSIPISDIKILFDNTNGEIEDLIKRTNNAFHVGTGVISKNRFLSRKNYLLKKLQKLEASKDDPLIFSYYLGQYYHFSLIAWFEHKQMWSKKISSALPFIKDHDSEFYRSLELMTGEGNLQTKIEAVKKIYSLLFNH